MSVESVTARHLADKSPEYVAAVWRVVNAAPALSDAQAARLAELLRPPAAGGGSR